VNDLPPILLLPPNRVRRNYRGGKLLDAIQGADVPNDGNTPEDWIASTTEAVNPGWPPVSNEGLAACVLPDGGYMLLRDLFHSNGDFYLGRRHMTERGPELGFLAKLLDAGMRLHIQAHPTAEFARAHLGSRWGKFETYLILDCREGSRPVINLGFQRPPEPAEWRRIILEQDLEAMAECFDPVPVKPGEVWMVPGGLPHALGEGLLLLEVMEPSDLVVRCEHTLEGIEVPPAGRYMGRDPELAMQIFDFTPLSVDDVTRRYRIAPTLETETGAYSKELLIGREQTDAFREYRHTIRTSASIPLEPCVSVWVVIGGSGAVAIGASKIEVGKGSKFLVAAAADTLNVEPEYGDLLMASCTPA